MWTTHYTSETDASRESVWAAIRALHSGDKLGDDSDEFELHGPFAVGTTISVTPQGQERMDSVITALEDGTIYEDCTSFGDLRLTFRHTLEDLPAGGTSATHTLTIDGPGSEEIGPHLGPQISSDFPSAMAELFAAAPRFA